MSWDRKQRGPGTGYFYYSKRGPDGVRKHYLGRGAVGQAAAALLDRVRRERQAARDAARAAVAATAEADRLAAEVQDWADLLVAAWMTVTGHHFHRGSWRRKRGQGQEA